MNCLTLQKVKFMNVHKQSLGARSGFAYVCVVKQDAEFFYEKIMYVVDRR